MVTINLLPWRDYLAAYQKRQTQKLCYLTLIVSVLAVIIATQLIIRLENNMRLHLSATQQAFNHVQRISTVVPKNANIPIWQRQLLEQNALMTQLLTTLTKAMNPAICFTQIKREDRAVILQGEVRSAEDLSEFLRHWPVATLFSVISIDQLKQVNHRQYFQLRALTENRQVNAL